MRFIKSKLFVAAIMVICLAISAYSTVAYYTTTAVAHNVITTGGVDIQIVETKLENGSEVPYPDEPILVMPGYEVSKIARVQNIDAPSYVRAMYEVELVQGNPAITTADVQKHVTVSGAGSKWTLHSDGWYYYNTALGTGDMSEQLFDTVTFDFDMGNEYQNMTVNVIVTVQAIQGANMNVTSAADITKLPFPDLKEDK